MERRRRRLRNGKYGEAESTLVRKVALGVRHPVLTRIRYKTTPGSSLVYLPSATQQHSNQNSQRTLASNLIDMTFQTDILIA